jgi:hypothetical protein
MLLTTIYKFSSIIFKSLNFIFMKKIFILFVSMMVLKAHAQNGKYETAMASTLQEFGQA